MEFINTVKQKTTYFYGKGSIDGFRSLLKEKLNEYSSYFIITDKHCEHYCLPTLIELIPELKSGKVIIVKDAEENKNLKSCSIIWEKLIEYCADRKSLVINLGGGFIGDVGGFSAATFKRGIPYINIPTTLLAQVDASVGGKTGVNFLGHKNMIGTFHFPLAVFIHEGFLKTLSDRQLLSGIAEMLKHGLILDGNYWSNMLESNLKDINVLSGLIGRSLQIKQAIIKKDPMEFGERKLLNFGHTVGHAIESYSMDTNKPLLHGEAIALGMICESYISYKTSGLKHGELDEICSFILGLYPSFEIPSGQYHRLIQLMRNDKKNSGTGINFTLINRIGEGIYNQNIHSDIIVDSLQFYSEKVLLKSN